MDVSRGVYPGKYDVKCLADANDERSGLDPIITIDPDEATRDLDDEPSEPDGAPNEGVP